MSPTGPERRKDETASPRIRMVRAGFGDLVLVCTKCAKRQSLKKGAVRRMLKRALTRRFGSGKSGSGKSGSGKSGSSKNGSSKTGPCKVRVVEVGCLGPCPKRALAVATSTSLSAHRIHLLDPAATPEAAVAALFPDFGPKGQVDPVSTDSPGNAKFP